MAAVVFVQRLGWVGFSTNTCLYRNYCFKPPKAYTTKVSELLTYTIKRAVWTRFIKAQNSLTLSTGAPVAVGLAIAGPSAIAAATSNQRRWLCTDVKRYQMEKEKESTHGNPYHLMNFEEVMWPSIIKSIKNYVFTYLVVRPYLDQDFTLDEFMKGSKHAFVYVSQLISQGDFDGLKGLVVDEAVSEIKRNYDKMNVKHRTELSFQPDDVYFAFPYQLGIMFDENTQPQKRYAEITVCFHCFRGFDEIRKRDPGLGSMYEFRDSIVVCNYRFVREYTKGVEDNWIINRLNHFKPVVV